MIQEPQQTPLQSDAKEHADDNCRREDREEAAEFRQIGIVVGADQCRRHVGAERIKCAMRDIQNFHHAKDNRQPDGDHEQIGWKNQTVDQDDD